MNILPLKSFYCHKCKAWRAAILEDESAVIPNHMFARCPECRERCELETVEDDVIWYNAREIPTGPPADWKVTGWFAPMDLDNLANLIGGGYAKIEGNGIDARVYGERDEALWTATSIVRSRQSVRDLEQATAWLEDIAFELPGSRPSDDGSLTLTAHDVLEVARTAVACRRMLVSLRRPIVPVQQSTGGESEVTRAEPVHREPVGVGGRCANPRCPVCGDQSRSGADCLCHLDCRQDSHSGRWHQHEDEPCAVHPDAPMVG